MTHDADKIRDVPVVIRYIQNKWCIAHAGSYQNAFGNSVNSFDTREDAVEFAENHDCEVFYHEHDQLQTHIAL
ncbi:hypothetical protein [Neptuniibacter sp. QD37_11]|uniref:hypothetical protein n=1 Tax=Neptuniibacter sp. QD37_11 TaxID=3398209 RepID=UPI0039F5326B